MDTEIEEILKFDPTRKTDIQDDDINEILKFDPVGETYQPKRPIPGGGPSISTITGKVQTEYKPGDEPTASFGSMMEASVSDDIGTKVRIYANNRGITGSDIFKRYRINNGNIEFKSEKGNWQREIGDNVVSRVQKGAADIVGHPSTYLGTAGAVVAGVPGAVGGAMLGEGIRKGIAKYIYDEPQTAVGNLIDVAIEGALALGGEAVGRVISGSINKFITRKVKHLRHAGKEVAEGLLTPADHAKATYIKALADKFDIQLAPHQLYDKEGMTNLWKYLRRHPVTSNAVQKFERKAEKASDEALEKFIREMGGYDQGSYAVGEKLKKTAEKAITDIELTRTAKVRPTYEKGFQEASAVGGVDISSSMQKLDDLIDGTPDGGAKQALKKVKKSFFVEDAPDTDLKRIQRAIFDLNDMIEGTSYEAAKISPSSKKFLKNELISIKKDIEKNIEKVSPSYIRANKRFKALSPEVDKLKKSVVGELSRLQNDKSISVATHKLFNAANMPDAKLLSEARKVIAAKDPELWRNAIGTYIRDVYMGLKPTQEGKVAVAVGKLNKALFGSKKQKEIMRAAFGGERAPEYQTFKGLMEVFQRAAIGTSRESMTAQFQQIGKEFGRIEGSRLYRTAMYPKAQAVESTLGRWNKMQIDGRQDKVMKALIHPGVQNQIVQLKRLTPRSKKFWDAFGVLSVMITSHSEQPE